MTDQSDILPTNQSMGGVADQLTGIPLHFPAERRWLIAMLFASLLLLLFMVSVVELFTRGVIDLPGVPRPASPASRPAAPQAPPPARVVGMRAAR